MYGITHLALGLIIGKATGDYPAAILGSLLIDVDHLWPAFKDKELFNLKKLLKRTTNSTDTSRCFFHNIFSWIILSVGACLINFHFGWVFSLAYLGHLILDAIDSSPFFPFFPIKKFNIIGFISYCSKKEVVFSLILFSIFIVFNLDLF